MGYVTKDSPGRSNMEMSQSRARIPESAEDAGLPPLRHLGESAAEIGDEMDFSQSDDESNMRIGVSKRHVDQPHLLPSREQRVAASGAARAGIQNVSIKVIDQKQSQRNLGASRRVPKQSSTEIRTVESSGSPTDRTPHCPSIGAREDMQEVKCSTQGADKTQPPEGVDCVEVISDSDREPSNSFEDRPAVDNRQLQGGQAHASPITNSVLVSNISQESEERALSSSISLGCKSQLTDGTEADNDQKGPTSRRPPQDEQQRPRKVPPANPKVLGKRVRMYN